MSVAPVPTSLSVVELHDNGKSPLEAPTRWTQKEASNDPSMTLCGFGRWRPSWLQKLHSSTWLLICLSISATTQSMVINGLVPASITTLEKRFGLRGGESGLYSSMYDIAVLLALLPVCYFGGKGSKSRWLGIGVFVMGVGSFASTLPHFFSKGRLMKGMATNDSYNADVCELSPSLDGDILGSTIVDNARYFFFVLLCGQVLHGVGATPLYTLGISYLDENVSPRYSALYMGIYYASSTVGAAFGFVLGGFFLSIYGDIDKVPADSISIQPTHPKWYGAWWIGYLITGLMAMLISTPLAAFGKELPEAKENNNTRIDQANVASKMKLDVSLHENPKALPKLCLGLLSNFTFTCLVVRECGEALLLNGFVTFIPKIIQNSFSFSASVASMITGLIIVPFAVVGSVLGGYLVSCFNLRCRAIIMLAAIFHFVSALFITTLLAGCPQQQVVGIDIPYNGNGSSVNSLLSDCNRDCHCDVTFNPVCDENSGNVYFSPCYAGCLATDDNDNRNTNTSAAKVRTWSHCQCLSRVESKAANSNQTDVVIEGHCPKSCSSMYLFFVLIALHTITVFMTAVASQQGMLRCVPFDQRTLALSLNWLFVRLLGCIPGPVIIGLFIDSACRVWETTDSGRSCLRLDDVKMRQTLFTLGESLKITTLVATALAWKFYVPPPTSNKSNELCADHKR